MLTAGGATVTAPSPTSDVHGAGPRAHDARFTVLMDLDGTISDSALGVYASFRHALALVGKPWPEGEPLNWVIGPPLTESFGKLLPPDEAAQALEHYRTHYAAGALFDNVPYPGIPEAVAALAAEGCRLFVATSKLQLFAERIVEHFGLAGYFDGIYGATEDGRIDGKAAVVAQCVAREQLDPTACIMVGDREHDVHGAAQNGIACIGVAWGYGSRAELEEAGAVAICDRPADLPPLIRKIVNARAPAATPVA